MAASHVDPAPVSWPATDSPGLDTLLNEFELRSGVPTRVLGFAELVEGELVPRVRSSGGAPAEEVRRLVGHCQALVATAAPGAIAVDPDPPFESLNGNALLCIPIVHGPGILGFVMASAGAEISEGRSAALQAHALALSAEFDGTLAGDRRRQLDVEADLLLEISSGLSESSQIPKLMPIIARNAARAAGYDRGTALLWDPSGAMAAGASQYATGHADIRLWGVFRAIERPLDGVQRALDLGQIEFFADPASELSLEPERWVVPHGIETVMVVPMLDREERVGAIILDSSQHLTLDPARAHAAQRIATQGAFAVNIARALQRERVNRQRSQLVLGTVVQAATQMNTTGVLSVLADGANEVLGDMTTVAFVIEGTHAAKLTLTGDGDGAIDVIDCFFDNENFIEGLSPLRSKRGGSRQFNSASPLPALHELGYGRALVVPVRRANRDLGWLLSYDKTTEPYLEDDVRIVSGIASQGALSLHTASLLEGERSAVMRLQDLDRLKTSFVAAVSHELRTPLTAIIGFTDLLSESIEDESLRGFIGDMQRESAVLEALIGNLLDTSRLEAGMLQLDRSHLDLSDVIAEAVDVVSHGYQDRDFVVDAPDELPQQFIDGVRLRQVLVNLIENACKYSPSGTQVDINVSADARGNVSIAVDDRGPGIPVEHRSAVFERFRRLATDSGKPGTGIGLYLVKALVEAHGGSIEAADRPAGQGARFLVTLPPTHLGFGLAGERESA